MSAAIALNCPIACAKVICGITSSSLARSFKRSRHRLMSWKSALSSAASPGQRNFSSSRSAISAQCAGEASLRSVRRISSSSPTRASQSADSSVTLRPLNARRNSSGVQLRSGMRRSSSSRRARASTSPAPRKGVRISRLRSLPPIAPYVQRSRSNAISTAG